MCWSKTSYLLGMLPLTWRLLTGPHFLKFYHYPVVPCWDQAFGHCVNKLSEKEMICSTLYHMQHILPCLWSQKSHGRDVNILLQCWGTWSWAGSVTYTEPEIEHLARVQTQLHLTVKSFYFTLKEYGLSESLYSQILCSEPHTWYVV